MFYVYLLESIGQPGERYVGITRDMKQRLADHTAGKSSHTSKFTPWQLVTYIAFSHEAKALAFERTSNRDLGTLSQTSVCGSAGE